MADDPLAFLSSIASFTQATKSPSSADKPVQLAVVDPDYVSGWPKVIFEGESTLSGKLYPHLDSYCPSPSDRVVMVPVGTTWIIVGAVTTSGSGVPPGSLQLYAASTPPDGWLSCDGSAVSRTTYARLFTAIGTAWGVGDGSTTFNLPDLRGRVPVGVGTGSGLTARTLADEDGAEAHTSVVAHTHTGPSHTHSLSGSTASDGNHQHSLVSPYTDVSGTVTSVSLSGGGSYSLKTAGSGSTAPGGSHTHSLSGTTSAAGTGSTSSTGSASVDHMPPFAAVTYMIKT